METFEFYDLISLNDITKQFSEYDLKRFLDTKEIPLFWMLNNDFLVTPIDFSNTRKSNSTFRNRLIESNLLLVKIIKKNNVALTKMMALEYFFTAESKSSRLLFGRGKPFALPRESQHTSILKNKKIIHPFFDEVFIYDSTKTTNKYRPLQEHEIEGESGIVFSIKNKYSDEALEITFEDIYIQLQDFEQFKSELDSPQEIFKGNEPYFSETVKLLINLANTSGKCIPNLNSQYPTKKELYDYIAGELKDEISSSKTKRDKIITRLVSLIRDRNHITPEKPSIYFTNSFMNLCLALKKAYSPIFNRFHKFDRDVIATKLNEILSNHSDLAAPPKNKDIQQILIECRIVTPSQHSIPSFLPPLLMTFKTNEILKGNKKI